MHIRILSTLLLASTLSLSGLAQTSVAESGQPTRHSWEIGVGGGLANWSRVAFTGFQETQEGYHMSLNAKHLLGGPSLYVAYEILPWLYVDAQGSADFAQRSNTGKQTSWKFWTDDFSRLYMGGLGLQLRLTPLFKSHYVEPYFRVGINYLYKDFASLQKGSFDGDLTGQGSWQYTDTWNSQISAGESKKSATPISFGLGVKSWISDCFGLGLQGEYLMPLQREAPRFARLTGSLLFRIGGESKQPAPRLEYVEVEKIVERPVEKIVEKRVVEERVLSGEIFELLSGIHFLFDSDEMTADSSAALDMLAKAIRESGEHRFLIIGMADAKGAEQYNKDLSERRAEVVYRALVDRKVSPDRLKHCGIGKVASLAPASSSDEARLGDRKVVIELVKNDAYWDAIK